MAYRVVRFEPTPNPNAIKCTVDPSPGDRPRSYFNRADAEQAGDALASGLFAIGPVTNVLIHTRFITVCKTPGASWSSLKPRIEAVLAGAG